MENRQRIHQAIPDARRCFVCGPDHPTGLQVRFEVSGEAVEATTSARADLEGWDGLLHGGIVSALHDEAAAWTMILIAGCTGVTTRSSVRYHRPIRTGDQLLVRGLLDQRDGDRYTVASRILHSNGGVASTGSSEYLRLDGAGFEKVLGHPISPGMRNWLSTMQ